MKRFQAAIQSAWIEGRLTVLSVFDPWRHVGIAAGVFVVGKVQNLITRKQAKMGYVENCLKQTRVAGKH